MGNEDHAPRVDATGRAFAGSQKQLQTCVNEREREFSKKVLGALNPPPVSGADLRWVSPLAGDGFKEYQDAEFLARLDLGAHADALREFWPKGGPCWDALALVTGCVPQGVVLVEAKSHISEMESDCTAKDPASKARIEASLAATKRRLGVDSGVDWMKGHYQAANRYAHVLFLRELGVPAWLVNIYFTGDKRSKTSADEWRAALTEVRKRMGLGGIGIPYASELILDAPNVEQ